MSGPAFGKRLVLTRIRELAEDAQAPAFMLVPKGGSSTPSDGFLEITYPLLASAIDRAAYFLDEQLGQHSRGAAFMFLGPSNDPRYIILMLAALKTSHKIFLPSPRNSLDIHLSLIERVEPVAVLTPADATSNMSSQIIERTKLKHVFVASLEALLNPITPDRPEYPYNEDVSSALRQPFLVLHTSGSTGVPKPITIQQGSLCAIDAYHLQTSLGAGPYALGATAGLRVFNPMPNFHIAAVIGKISMALFWSVTTIESGSAPLSAATVIDFVSHPSVEAAWIVPSISRDIAADPVWLSNLSLIKYAITGGAPMAEHVADIVGSKTHYVNVIGMTEASLYPNELTDPEDFSYVKLTEHTGYCFEPIADDIYELVIQRSPALEHLQAVFYTFPSLQEFRTGDTFSKHPSKPDLWMYRGRLDDIVVLENAEKFNPNSMQECIERHPEVGVALIGGTGRFQPYLVLEPRNPVQDAAAANAFIDSIFPYVAEANRLAQSYAKIVKSMILVTDPAKPFVRTAKASIQRSRSLDQYKAEVDELYRLSTSQSPAEIRADFTTVEQSLSSLTAIFSELGIRVSSTTDDFFAAGMDSLLAANLSRRLREMTARADVQPRLIYSNPTPGALAAALTRSQDQSIHSSGQVSREGQMSKALARLSETLTPSARTALPKPSKHIVILTGSTGSLGSYILDCLLRDSSIERVCCLNRSADSQRRQELSMEAKDLMVDLNRAEFLNIDPQARFWGLDRDRFARLLETATLIIHNAWPVDFNQTLHTMLPQVDFVRKLIDLSSHSRHGAYIYFISTIGTTTQARERPIKEQIMRDWSVSGRNGYSESKHISEVLLEEAASLGVSASVARVGQIAGPVTHGTKGQWNKQEWFPALIASSLFLGAMPQNLGLFEAVDWVPVDIVAQAVVELAVSGAVNDVGPLRVQHLVNPAAVPWSALSQIVLDCIPARKRPHLIPLEEWVRLLEASEAAMIDEHQLRLNPAFKLIDFFRGLSDDRHASIRGPALDTEVSQRQSRVLRECSAVSPAWLKMWMQQWAFA